MNEVLTTEQTQYANQIRNTMTVIAKNHILLGQQLINAKKHLKHGEFIPMLESIGMSKRTAQEYMSISRLEIVSRSADFALLENFKPHELKKLDKMDKEEAQEIIESGVFPKNVPPEKKTNAKTEEVYTKEQVMELLMRVKNGEEIEFNGQTIKVEFTDVEVVEPVVDEKSEFTIEDVDYDFIFNNINELWSKLEAYEKNQMDRMGVISELHYVKMDGLALAAICHSGMVEASDVTRVLNHFGDMKQKDIAIKLGVSSTAVGVMQSGKPIKQGGKVARAIGEYIFNNRCEIQ